MTDPEPAAEKFSAEYAKLRSKKGVTIEQKEAAYDRPELLGR